MDEMILIPKILESVTCNVYKSRVAALMRYNEILLNLLCKTRIQFSSKYCQENKHGIRAHKLIPKRGVSCEKHID
jgi:hypothetical protein